MMQNTYSQKSEKRPLGQGTFAKTAVFVFFAALSLTAVAEAKGVDLSLLRPSKSVWYTQGQEADNGFSAIKWGLPTDVPVAGDFDGDGISDSAVWRPETGAWHILKSSTGLPLSIDWGSSKDPQADIPITADFDGDGITDIAVFRPGNGFWYVLNSSANFDQTRPSIFCWGMNGDVPVPADYDGDGRADHAVFRTSENRWYIFESSSQRWNVKTFGKAGEDLLVPADYTGDGRADIAVFRNGTWLVLDSSTGETDIFEFGFADSIPVPADYDGDGQTDFAVWREGTWYIYDSEGPRFRTLKFGDKGDIPVGSLQAKKSN